MTMDTGRDADAIYTLRERFDKRWLWMRYLRLATQGARIGELEAAVWTAVAWYADAPCKASELELRRAARAFGIEPPVATGDC